MLRDVYRSLSSWPQLHHWFRQFSWNAEFSQMERRRLVNQEQSSQIAFFTRNNSAASTIPTAISNGWLHRRKFSVTRLAIVIRSKQASECVCARVKCWGVSMSSTRDSTICVQRSRLTDTVSDFWRRLMRQNYNYTAAQHMSSLKIEFETEFIFIDMYVRGVRCAVCGVLNRSLFNPLTDGICTYILNVCGGAYILRADDAVTADGTRA